MIVKRKIIFYAIVTIAIIAVLIFCLVLLELYASYAYYKYRDTLKGDIRVIRLKEPFKNSETYHTTPDGETHRFRTDSNRFILPYNDLTDASFKVFFVGGSTTECATVDEDKRVHVLVSSILEKKLGKKISCVNSAHSGNHSMLTMNLILNRLIQYKPDVFVINHNINDISILTEHGSYWNRDKQRSLIVDNSDYLFQYKVGYPKNKFIRTYFPNTALVLFPTFFESALIPDFKPVVPRKYSDGSALSTEHLIKTFKSSVQSLIDLCKAWDITPVLMTQASNRLEHIQEKYASFNTDRTHNLMNEAIRQLTIENDLYLIDAEKKMEDVNNYFVDFVHYNNWGAEFISKEIAEVVHLALIDEK